MITTWGLDHASFANATRDFCPPERNLRGRNARGPEMSKRPKNFRISWNSVDDAQDKCYRRKRNGEMRLFLKELQIGLGS